MKKIIIIGLTFISFQTVFSQTFTRKDSLQGGLRAERTCYDVLRYDLNIKINIESFKLTIKVPSMRKYSS